MVLIKFTAMAPEVTQQETQISFFQVVSERMQEGGIFFMSLILICGIIILVLAGNGIYKAIYKKSGQSKNILLINSIGLFALVLGIFRQLLQLIETLDAMEYNNVLQLHEITGGLKVTILPTIFGCLILLIARFTTIILQWLHPSVKA